VAEGVAHDPVALAPEHFGHRSFDRRTPGDRAGKSGVDVIKLEQQHDR
jgi:hypothetical protein